MSRLQHGSHAARANDDGARQEGRQIAVEGWCQKLALIPPTKFLSEFCLTGLNDGDLTSHGSSFHACATTQENVIVDKADVCGETLM